MTTFNVMVSWPVRVTATVEVEAQSPEAAVLKARALAEDPETGIGLAAAAESEGVVDALLRAIEEGTVEALVDER